MFIAIKAVINENKQYRLVRDHPTEILNMKIFKSPCVSHTLKPVGYDGRSRFLECRFFTRPQGNEISNWCCLNIKSHSIFHCASFELFFRKHAKRGREKSSSAKKWPKNSNAKVTKKANELGKTVSTIIIYRVQTLNFKVPETLCLWNIFIVKNSCGRSQQTRKQENSGNSSSVIDIEFWWLKFELILSCMGPKSFSVEANLWS